MRRKKGFLTRRKIMIMSSLLAIGMLVTIVNIFVGIVTAKEAESLTFQSTDGLKITADVYLLLFCFTRLNGAGESSGKRHPGLTDWDLIAWL